MPGIPALEKWRQENHFKAILIYLSQWDELWKARLGGKTGSTCALRNAIPLDHGLRFSVG